MRRFSLCFLIILCEIIYPVQLWPIPFKTNSHTLPSIEVKLAPPEDPLPQVSAEIQLLERARIRVEEGMMARLEDEYNNQLDKAQTRINEAVNKAVKLFDDKKLLNSVVKGTLLPVKLANIKEASHRIMPTYEHGSFVERHNYPTSFEEVSSSTEERSRFLGVNPSNPNFKVELADIKPPDDKIKTKMEQIEQKRTDEESKLFEQGMVELGQLTEITIQELEKNVQIEMNSFLADSRTVGKFVQSELGGLGSPVFREATSEQTVPVSFVEQGSKRLANLLGSNQLNVKVASSDTPYPTIDELVSDMQKKRDATERLERMKILELELKLIKAQTEMIKDSLHAAVSRVLAQYAPVIDSIKNEFLEEYGD